MASDTVILMGRREQRVFIIRSRDLVIVRLGREAGSKWTDTYLPNTLVRALDRARGRPRDRAAARGTRDQTAGR